MNQKFLYIGLISIFVMVNISFIIINVNAQTVIRKEFVYCPPIESALQSSKYLDNSEIRYEINGCPVTRVYIEDWQNVKVIDQNKIIAEMAKNGFTEEISE